MLGGRSECESGVSVQAVVVTDEVNAAVAIEGEQAGGSTVAVVGGQIPKAQTWAGMTVTGNSRLFSTVQIASRNKSGNAVAGRPVSDQAARVAVK